MYPERKRCKQCGKKLDRLILEGLYCSYKCGKFPLPAKTLAEAPRGCKREVNRKWDYKTRFNAPSLVPEKLRNDAAINIYACDNCRMFHIGHSRVEPFETLTRYVNNAKELGSVIQRHREGLKIDKKLLAKTLKVPVIRITEVEEGSKNVQMYVVFAILEYLKIKISLIDARRRN